MESIRENLVFKVHQARFWLVIVPVTAIFVALQIKLSLWAFRVFSPKVDLPLRITFGFGPILLAILAVVICIVLHRVYLYRSFEIQTAGLLVRGWRGQQKLLRWEDTRVQQFRNSAILGDSAVRVKLHRYFLPELRRFCQMVEHAHRYRRDNLYM